MSIYCRLLTGLAIGLLSVNGFCFVQPDPQETPGSICTESDPNFLEYRYPAHVAYCNRNVGTAEKEEIAKFYKIPRADWSKYEFDHLIPLSAGGSDEISNIWPQPLDEARLKDEVEQDVFNKLDDGSINQQQAIQEIRDWFQSPDPNETSVPASP